MYPSYLKASKSPLRPARTCGLPIEVNMYFFFLYMLYWYRAVYSHRFSWFWAWWKVKLRPLLGIATTACFVICCSFDDVGTCRICCSALLNNNTWHIAFAWFAKKKLLRHWRSPRWRALVSLSVSNTCFGGTSQMTAPIVLLNNAEQRSAISLRNFTKNRRAVRVK